MNTLRLTKAISVALFSVILGGCFAPNYRVGVSGFCDPSYSAGRSYWLLSGKKGVTADDLEFREYAAYLRRGLGQAGFTEAPSFEQADLGVFVSYGIGDTKERQYSYTLPIYGQTGGGVYNYSGTSYSGSGATTTYGTIYQQPQFGVVGSQAVSGTDVTHLRYLYVDALDLKAYRNEKKTVSVWRTDIMSRGSSADLRKVFPVLVVAATPHFGKNTAKQIVLDVSDTDKRLLELRNGGSK